MPKYRAYLNWKLFSVALIQCRRIWGGMLPPYFLVIEVIHLYYSRNWQNHIAGNIYFPPFYQGSWYTDFTGTPHPLSDMAAAAHFSASPQLSTADSAGSLTPGICVRCWVQSPGSLLPRQPQTSKTCRDSSGFSILLVLNLFISLHLLQMLIWKYRCSLAYNGVTPRPSKLILSWKYSKSECI